MKPARRRNIPARKIAAALPVVREWEQRGERREAMIVRFVAGLLAGGRRGKPETLAAEAAAIADAVLRGRR